ncbi:hypothetical protein [Treponema putidum]|uniref:hypothetical protein n=1 Tax=Treponema putidum TaxID=221027 RepID=UPI003D8D7F5B
MLFKGKNKFIFIAVIILLVIYIFAAAVPMKENVYLMPEWASPIPQVQNDEIYSREAGASSDELKQKFAGKTPIAFSLGNSFGYFAEDGEILRAETAESRFSASFYAWTKYPQKPLFTDIYKPDEFDIQKPFLRIDEPGYVYLDKDRIFLFKPEGSSLSQYDKTGKELWTYTHTSPITAFQSSKAGCVIGHSDGLLVCLDSDGNTLFSFYPGGSTYQAVMGAAISEDGKQVLCLCGLNKQRVVLINVLDHQHKIVFHYYFERDLRRQTFASFDKSGSFAVFESADGIGIIDCKSLKLSIIKEDGFIIGMGIQSERNLLTVLVQKENECSLLLIDPPNFMMGKTKFNSKNAFLIQKENKIYIGTDDKIAAFEIRGL